MPRFTSTSSGVAAGANDDHTLTLHRGHHMQTVNRIIVEQTTGSDTFDLTVSADSTFSDKTLVVYEETGVSDGLVDVNDELAWDAEDFSNGRPQLYARITPDAGGAGNNDFKIAVVIEPENDLGRRIMR